MSTTAQQSLATPTMIERRFYSRVAPQAPIYVAIDGKNESLLLNVGENGLLVSTPTELRCNFVALIAIPLNGLSKPVRVYVRVVWASEARMLAGIQLLNLSEDDREQIRNWGAQASTPSSISVFSGDRREYSEDGGLVRTVPNEVPAGKTPQLHMRVRGDEIREGEPTRKVPILPVVLSFASVILLATKVYFVREVLVFLALMGLVAFIGTTVLLLVVFPQEGVRWSISLIKHARRGTILVESPLPKTPDGLP